MFSPAKTLWSIGSHKCAVRPLTVLRLKICRPATERNSSKKRWPTTKSPKLLGAQLNVYATKLPNSARSVSVSPMKSKSLAKSRRISLRRRRHEPRVQTWLKSALQLLRNSRPREMEPKMREWESLSKTSTWLRSSWITCRSRPSSCQPPERRSSTPCMISSSRTKMTVTAWRTRTCL